MRTRTQTCKTPSGHSSHFFSLLELCWWSPIRLANDCEQSPSTGTLPPKGSADMSVCLSCLVCVFRCVLFAQDLEPREFPLVLQSGICDLAKAGFDRSPITDHRDCYYYWKFSSFELWVISRRDSGKRSPYLWLSFVGIWAVVTIISKAIFFWWLTI